MALAQGRDRSMYNYGRDPRGTSWSNDESKFGFRMLQKHGWEKGAGLGKSQNGMTKHVSVRKKKGNLGIGADANHDYNWLETQDAFSEVLAGLNDEICGDVSIDKQPEPKGNAKQRYVNRRSRALYGRFKKSKDLGAYSSDDLQCILGEQDKRPDRYVNEKDTQDGDKPAVDPNSGVQTLTQTVSVGDYFAAKLAARKAGASTNPSLAVAPVPSPLTDDSTEQDASLSISTTETKAKKKKSKSKKKDKGSSKSQRANQSGSAGNDNAGADSSTDVAAKKSKKKSRKRATDSSELKGDDADAVPAPKTSKRSEDKAKAKKKTKKKGRKAKTGSVTA